jgi:NAD(P)-dependent dehydrogenase (short-subunit alcohol dehydrogenase family)
MEEPRSAIEAVLRANRSVFDLTDRVAIITGGGTGIGCATALAFARHGAHSVLASRREENLERVAGEVRALGRRALAVKTDVRKLEDLERLVKLTLDEFGAIDILVNNAGGSHQRDILDETPETYDRMMALNLRSVFFLSQYVARHMIERKRGAIINISSGAARGGLPFVSPYGAAKAAAENLTKTMAAAWGRHRIRVNCIEVGAIKSEGFLAAMQHAGADPDVVGGSNAAGRAGWPEEVAYPILFFASDAADYVSGQTIAVNGGPPPGTLG